MGIPAEHGMVLCETGFEENTGYFFEATCLLMLVSGTIYQCQYKSFVVQNCKRMNQKKINTGNDGCSGTAIAETTAIAD